jgi:hypothetical protein
MAPMNVRKRGHLSFQDAKSFVHSLKLKNRNEWNAYCKSGKKPDDIPTNPGRSYGKEWKGWGDWLGTGNIAVTKRVFRDFNAAREYVHSLGIKSKPEWERYRQSKELPKDIPTDPSSFYRDKGWRSWGDWLGTGNIADKDRNYRSFDKAREFVHTLGMTSKEEWEKYCKSGDKPPDVPYHPDRVYKKDWKWWADWLGYEAEWNIKKIKELLRDLIASGIIYRWNEAVLYSLLDRNELLNLKGNRHHQIFNTRLSVHILYCWAIAII